MQATPVRELVPRHPVAALLATLVVTGVLGAFATQSVMEDGVAVENEYSRALDVLDERFALSILWDRRKRAGGYELLPVTSGHAASRRRRRRRPCSHRGRKLNSCEFAGRIVVAPRPLAPGPRDGRSSAASKTSR